MTDRATHSLELDSLRSEWRKALLAARDALRAEEGLGTEEGGLASEELVARERQLRTEYEAAAAELRQFALDEGLPAELAEPFLPRGRAHEALLLPDAVRSCVFELEDVLVASAGLHREAWTRTFEELLASRADTTWARRNLPAPFDPRVDYRDHIEGRPRLEGVRVFLASRGIRLPEGQEDDAPGAPTVHGVASRKNELVGLLLEQRGVGAFEGARHYLELARDAGISCAVVSPSAHTSEMLDRSGLAELVDVSIGGETGTRAGGSSPDRLTAACRRLQVEPQHAAVFETREAAVAAARAAGFAWVVAVDRTGDPGRLRKLRHAGADVAVRGLGDLLERAA